MTEGWLFYDGSCRICRLLAKIAQTLSVRRALGLVDIRKLPKGLRRSFPITSVHTYRKRRILTGAMALLQIMMLIPVVSFIGKAFVRSVEAFALLDKSIYPFLSDLRLRQVGKGVNATRKSNA